MDISEYEEKIKGKPCIQPQPPLQKSCVHCVHNMYLRTHFSWNRFKKRGLYTLLKTYLSNQKNKAPFFRVLNVLKASEIAGSLDRPSDRLTDRQTLWFIGKLHF